MAAYQQLHSLRPPAPSTRRPLGLASVPVLPAPLLCCRRNTRALLASFRPSPPPSSAYPPLPKKRAAAAGLGVEEEDRKVLAVEESALDGLGKENREYAVSVGADPPTRLRAGDPVFFLLTAVAVTTSLAFTSMVAVAIPTMLAMRRAANSFCMLADAAAEELPSTMAAIRLSGMEISDLTLELSDLSYGIADGVNKSAKVAEAVEAGIGQMGDIARRQARTMIKERANLQTFPTGRPDELP